MEHVKVVLDMCWFLIVLTPEEFQMKELFVCLCNNHRESIMDIMMFSTESVTTNSSVTTRTTRKVVGSLVVKLLM
jgi:hypothetical protein